MYTKSEDQKKKTVTISLSQPAVAKLKELAEQKHMSQSGLLEFLIWKAAKDENFMA